MATVQTPAAPVTPRPRIPRRDSPLVRLVDRMVLRMYGRRVDSVGIAGHRARLLLGMGLLDMAVERDGALDPRLRHLAELKTASVVGCAFCLDIGSHLARKSGLSDDQLGDLHAHPTSPHFSPLERLVCDYAVAMSRTPPQVDDDLVVRLREHFDDGQLVELSFAVGWENFRARTNHAFGIPPAGFSAGAACARPEADGG